MRAVDKLHDGEPDRLPDRVLRALDRTDHMSPALRSCVHEFGTEIVEELVQAGVKDPKLIRKLVHNIWMGARQPHQRNRIMRERSPVLDSLDWILMQSGAGATAQGLLRILWANNMVIVPREPNSVMVDASMNAVNHMGTVTKSEKHKNRLRAAITASSRRLWPHLFDERANS